MQTNVTELDIHIFKPRFRFINELEGYSLCHGYIEYKSQYMIIIVKTKENILLMFY